MSGISLVRQLLRLPDGGRRDRLRARVRRQPAGQRHVRRPRARPTASSGPGPRASATRSSTSATRPGATASTAPPWPPPPSTSTRRSGGPPCRWAIRSPRSCSSRRAWRRWPPAPWSGSRTWAPPAWPAAPRRCRPAAAPGWTWSCRRSRSARTGMTPYELLLSESQERMLLVGARGREEELRRVFAKLGARRRADRRGDGSRRRLRGPPPGRRGGASAGGGPGARRRSTRSPSRRPRGWPSARPSTRSGCRPRPTTVRPCSSWSARPHIASKEWAFRQYDQQVGINTLVLPGSDASVLRVKGTRRAIAVATDGNGRQVFLDPRMGAALAVCEAARNVSVRGRPAARRHRLPELRLPRAARDPVAVRGGGGGDRRGLPCARAPGSGRQRFPLQ